MRLSAAVSADLNLAPMMDSLIDQLLAAIPGHWEKVIATVLLIGAALLFSYLWSRYLARGEIAPQKRRLHLVWARNIIWFAVSLVKQESRFKQAELLKRQAESVPNCSKLAQVDVH